MKRILYLLPTAAAVLLTLSVPATVHAGSPSFARSAEEWAQLQDNKIEYDEIADLVHEYNVTVKNNDYALWQFRKDYGDTNDEASLKYYSLAQDTYAEMTGDSVAADLQKEIQADNYMQQASNTLEDSSIYRLTYEKEEMGLVKSAQSAMINVYQLTAQAETAAAAVKDAETKLNEAELKKSAGMATELEVLDAKQAKESAENALNAAEQSLKTQKEKLNVMLGWTYDALPEIGSLPVPEEAEVAAMDPAVDLAKALENNYTLRINRKKLENAKDDTTRQNRQTIIDNNEKQIGTSLTQAYRTLLTAKLSKEKAEAEMKLGEQNLGIARAKLEAGMITQNTYDTQLRSTEKSRRSAETAQYSYLAAVEGYRWAVNGLAAAE